MLEVHSLSKSYGNNPALIDINLSVEKGIIFGLLGPNGAGKTTLIRIINQIIEADSGEVKINNKILNPEHIKNIGYLPEERGLYKKMKVGEQLLYFAQLKGLRASEAKQRVKYWTEKLDISAWKDKRIEDLSKGMAQKIQFIATVIHEPELLILDEPFSGFDPVNAELIKDEIIDLKNKGTSVILSTHRMESVNLLCDHIAMINKAKKVLDGTVEEIRQLSRKNLFELKLRLGSESFPPHWIKQPSAGQDTKFHIMLNGGTTNQLLQEALTYGEVLSFEEIIPSIGEIFIQLAKDTDHE
ncbi:ABC transporter ATP-binding protein [Anditalea andensis]|uniref:ABC transporter ATP-binding protein n=1 Tax=Anditalea andensis TaxID=1048983 RepID=A0A074KZ13_9BACT|nr:ABC transporter ATP-binding protein [Anditalea andensis]